MINFFKSIEDRYLLLLLTLLFAGAYYLTRDKIFSDLAILVTGVTIGVLKDRSAKTLILSDSEQSKAIVNEFLAK